MGRVKGVDPTAEILARARLTSRSREPTQEERRFYEGVIIALARRRRQLRKTQAEVDTLLGVTDGQVAKWESFARFPSSFMMFCWASALGVQFVVHNGDTTP
jgi:DNA-binding transcriptional regulator YiaG